MYAMRYPIDLPEEKKRAFEEAVKSLTDEQKKALSKCENVGFMAVCADGNYLYGRHRDRRNEIIRIPIHKLTDIL